MIAEPTYRCRFIGGWPGRNLRPVVCQDSSNQLNAETPTPSAAGSIDS